MCVPWPSSAPWARKSPGPQVAYGFVAFEEIEKHAQCLTALAREFRIPVNDHARVVARRRKQIRMYCKIGESKQRNAALQRTEQLACTPEAQILLRNDEPVVGFANGREARFRQFAQGRLIEENTRRVSGAAADPSPQLMQLGKAKPLRMLDHHDRRLGHVDAN